HPEHEYVAAELGGRTLVVAAALLPALGARLGAGAVRARFRGAALDGARCRHPWLDRTVPIVLADYVTLETGTGLVHTAPGHGAGRAPQPRARGDRARALDPRLGPRADRQHDRDPAGLVHLAPARLGRAGGRGLLRGVRRGDRERSPVRARRRRVRARGLRRL